MVIFVAMCLGIGLLMWTVGIFLPVQGLVWFIVAILLIVIGAICTIVESVRTLREPRVRTDVGTITHNS